MDLEGETAFIINQIKNDFKMLPEDQIKLYLEGFLAGAGWLVELLKSKTECKHCHQPIHSSKKLIQ